MKEKWKLHIIAIMALVVFIVLGLACASTGSARDTIPQTAVTLQRVRSTILSDQIMEVNVSNVKHELANGETKTILVNNGEHMVFAVMGEVESKSVRFTAKSQTITVNVTPKQTLFGSLQLDIEVK